MCIRDRVFPAAEIEHTGEVGVPSSNAVVEGDNSHNGDREGENDLGEELERGTAVDNGSLLDTVGDGGLEVGAHDNHVVGAHEGGENDGPEVADEVELLDDKVERLSLIHI